MSLVAVLAFALNLTDRIKTYGAYAGFAAIIGLAVLSVLYFAQAREVKRLRAWAGRGPERAAEQGARTGPDPSKRVVAEPIAKPEPATAAAQSPAPAPAAGVAAATAAGAGAAVAGAATVATEGESQNGDGDEAKPAEDATDGEAAAGADTPGDATPDATAAQDKPATDDKAAAPEAKPEEDKRQASVAMAPIPASARVRPSATPRAPRTPATPVTGADTNGDGGGHRTRWIIGGGVAAVLVIGVVLAFALGGGGGKSPPLSNPIITTPTTVANHTTHPPSGAVQRSKVTVVVLNGTTTFQLAKTIGTRLSGGGFQVPGSREGNAPVQTHATTVVSYAPGQKAAALEVAKSLGLGADAVTAIDPDVSAAAGPGQLSVVVTVGSDLAH